MAEPGYRFLPWTRRGLAGGITRPDAPALPARVDVSVGITVTGAGDASSSLRLYGPGDVVGVDPRLIVRMEPLAGATDVEPNYVPAIEFDPPDFPWLFTPAAADAQGRLRPWCVLVVVDVAVVAPPHLERGMPLPVIDVPGHAVLTELPDLAESWGWAHTQVLGDPAVPLQQELAGARDRQLSRLLCPRRLAPNRHWCACLVPAFDVGVLRGLGGVPAEDATLGPAWSTTDNRDVRLPVYFHWEFVTGPQGDFESLARALTPFKVDPATVGSERMFVGDAGSGLPQFAADDARATMAQDGALRAPLAVNGTLDEVAAELRTGLRSILNQAADIENGPAALGPPLYASWPIDRHTLSDDVPPWFAALNLDPRARVAAGLGAEVVRANQEAFMATCWDQVGSVLDANEALSRARLALEAGRHTHRRHIAPLPADVLAEIAAPLHARVRHGPATVRSAIAATSLPDATVSTAMRRLTSGQRPVLKRVARLRGGALPPSRSARPLLTRSLAAGRTDVDPTRFTPGGVLGLDFLDRATGSGDTVDLTEAGVPMRLTADQFGLLKTRFRAVSALADPHKPVLVARTNLQSAGLITGVHLEAIQTVTKPSPKTVVGTRGLLDGLLAASQRQPGAVSWLITVGVRSGETRIDAVDVDPEGRVKVRPGPITNGVLIATMAPSAARATSARIETTLAALPPDTLDRRGRDVVDLGGRRPGGTGEVKLGSRTTNTIASPITDALVITRFRSAFTKATKMFELERAETPPPLVSFPADAVRATVVQQTDPTVVVRLRTVERIRIAGERLDRASRPDVKVAPAFDRIMATPAITTPLYELLADYDRTRLLPGVDRIPDDAVTLLETNARFVAAFLAGANHEMNRELLWRRYPTDQRGTVLRRFWDWLDGGSDIPPLHTWIGGDLGDHARGGDGGLLVLLVRGRLLRRYPNSVIYAWRAAGRKLKDPPAESDLRAPVFGGRFPPDITFVGFDLAFEEITQGDGWFFVIQQQPTEPRFGFDETPPEFPSVPPTWSDATWDDMDVVAGRHIALAGNPRAGETRQGATFGRDAAHLAAVLLQKPMRVALHGSQLAALR